MHPTDILSGEHREIERKLDEVEREIRNSGAGDPFPREFFDAALAFFRDFADGTHHAKEERLLFPRMEACGVPRHGGPIGVMLAEHEQGRAYLRAARANLDAAHSVEAVEAVRENALGYINLLRNHINKEDNILFRMAQAVLAERDVAELLEEFAAVAASR